MVDAVEVKTMKGAELDAAGAEMHLDRVSRARGHGFDESDDSYRRRLLAQIVGPVAADAMSQPADTSADAPARGDDEDDGSAAVDAAIMAAQAQADQGDQAGASDAAANASGADQAATATPLP